MIGAILKNLIKFKNTHNMDPNIILFNSVNTIQSSFSALCIIPIISWTESCVNEAINLGITLLNNFTELVGSPQREE